jgi:hypothetical protein
MHTYFDLHNIEIVLLAAVLACIISAKESLSKKDRSVTEAMTSDDVKLVSCAQYIAVQMVKNREIEGYGQHEVSSEGRE